MVTRHRVRAYTKGDGTKVRTHMKGAGNVPPRTPMNLKQYSKVSKQEECGVCGDEVDSDKLTKCKSCGIKFEKDCGSVSKKLCEFCNEDEDEYEDEEREYNPKNSESDPKSGTAIFSPNMSNTEYTNFMLKIKEKLGGIKILGCKKLDSGEFTPGPPGFSTIYATGGGGIAYIVSWKPYDGETESDKANWMRTLPQTVGEALKRGAKDLR